MTFKDIESTDDDKKETNNTTAETNLITLGRQKTLKSDQGYAEELNYHGYNVGYNEDYPDDNNIMSSIEDTKIDIDLILDEFYETISTEDGANIITPDDYIKSIRKQMDIAIVDAQNHHARNGIWETTMKNMEKKDNASPRI